jgi:hypothetical protein
MQKRSSEGCRSCGGSSRPRNVLVVQSRSDLNLLKTWSRRYDDIQLRFGDLSEPERSRLEDAIRGEYFQCGCVAARRATIFTLGTAIVVFIFAREAIWNASWAELATAVFACLFVPLATMLFSIAAARRRLWHLLRVT